MRLLILGDTHIPTRSPSIPQAIFDFARDFGPHAILFTGDATEAGVLLFLEKIAPVYAVKGNMDNIDVPLIQNLNFEGKRIILLHGHQFGRDNYEALTKYASGNDILVCGHTHHQEHFVKKGILVVNPGTATGAPTGRFKPPASFTTIIIKDQVEVEEYTVNIDGIQKQGSKSKDKIQVSKKD